MIQIDMDMPESCMVCPICHDHTWCHAPVPLEWGESDVSMYMLCRPEWCPLKEQKAVTIKKTKEHGFGVYGGICPKCHNWIQSAHSFCGFCGQAVKWNA